MESAQFPRGLKVLLVDDFHSAASIKAQLESPSLQYAVTAVHNATDALNYVRSGIAAFQVVLAESRIVAADEAIGRCFIDSFDDTPVVLMSAGSTPGDVMRAVRMGAVDFLDKPLSHLKLKNIWQHSVRKMMAKAAGPRCERTASLPCPATPSVPPTPTALASWPSCPAPPPPAHALALSPESPATPSASAADLPAVSMSCDDASLRSSGVLPECESFMDAMNSAMGGPLGGLSRPASCTSLPAAPLAHNAAVAPAHWPALEAGCVWGTPANGPVPPPLAAPARPPAPAPLQLPSSPASPCNWNSPPLSPTAPESPVLLKSAPSGVLPVAATTDELMVPEGFLSDAASCKTACGPLGLQLKKSASLLNLINSALVGSSHGDLSGLAAMVF